MKTSVILTKLSKYLDEFSMGKLRIVLSVKGDIGLCLAIHKIVYTQDMSLEDEATVSTLLSQLCKNHFKEARIYDVPVYNS